LVGMNAKPVAHDLLEHCLVALALRDASGKQRQRAGAVEAYLGAFKSERSGALDRIGNAKTTKLAALFRFRTPLGKALDVRLMTRLIENAFELPAVVRKGEPRLVRHRVRRDEVAPPQLHRIDAGLGGREIDQPLDDISRLGASVAAIGAHWVGVRVD